MYCFPRGKSSKGNVSILIEQNQSLKSNVLISMMLWASQKFWEY